jgi:hypothetical protein
LRLLDVCRWILVFILFVAIDTCCVKGWKIAHQIFAYKGDEFITSSCSFPMLFVRFVLLCYLLLSSYSLLVHFPLVV